MKFGSFTMVQVWVLVHSRLTRGVCLGHTVTLPFTLKSIIIMQNKNYGNTQRFYHATI
jgi:hypothetical protein